MITIIGLVVGLIGPRVLNYLGESKVKTARIQIQGFSSALDLYYLDTAVIRPARKDSARWFSAAAAPPRGMVLTSREGMFRTIRGAKPYIYRSPGEHGNYDITSYGADGQEGGTGTASDVTNWAP